MPDITVIYRGYYIAIEVKRENTKLSEAQAEFGLRVVRNGGYYIVVRSVSDVIKELKTIKIAIKNGEYNLGPIHDGKNVVE